MVTTAQRDLGALGCHTPRHMTQPSSPPSPRSLVQDNPEVAVDCIVYMSQHISPAERAQVIHLLSTMDSAAST